MFCFAQLKKYRNKSERGFTLLETLLAIGILSVVVVQVLSVQSSNVAISQISRDNIRATWALRQAVSQLQYVLDAQGSDGLPKEKAQFLWTAEGNYDVLVTFKDVNIEASRMLMAALKLSMGGGDSEGGAENDPTAQFKDLAGILDSKLPKDMYKTYTMTVSWKEGEAGKTRSLDAGGLIINDKVIENLMTAANAASNATSPTKSGTPAPSGTSAPTPTTRVTP